MEFWSRSIATGMATTQEAPAPSERDVHPVVERVHLPPRTVWASARHNRSIQARELGRTRDSMRRTTRTDRERQRGDVRRSAARTLACAFISRSSATLSSMAFCARARRCSASRVAAPPADKRSQPAPQEHEHRECDDTDDARDQPAFDNRFMQVPKALGLRCRAPPCVVNPPGCVSVCGEAHHDTRTRGEVVECAAS